MDLIMVKRFNPVDYYDKKKNMPTALRGATTKLDRVKLDTSPTTALGGVARVAGTFAEQIRAANEKQVSEERRKMRSALLRAYMAPKKVFDPSTFDASEVQASILDDEVPEELDEQMMRIPDAEAVALESEKESFGRKNPSGMEAALRAQSEFVPPESGMFGPGAGAYAGMGDKTIDELSLLEYNNRLAKEEREKALAGTIAKEERETLNKIRVAEAKPPTNPARYKEWKLSGSKLSFEKYMENDDLRKQGLTTGSEGQIELIPGGPADIKQQKVKLQETSNALMREKVALMERRLDPEYVKEIEGIRKSQAYSIDLQKSRPKARGSINTLRIKGEKVAAIIADALPLAKSLLAAGPGTMLKGVWNTDSRKLAGLLTNLKAIIGFDTLAEMRANSPTGGALGQVSNIEINLLQAVQGTLDQGQQELLIRSLTDIQGNYPRLLSWAEERFKEQYAPLEEKTGSDPKVIRFDENGEIIQ
jgi:hypothetical protein